MMRLIIPEWRPMRLNETMGRHFHVIGRRKKQDRAIVWAYCLKERAPAATGKRRVSLEITLSGRQKEADIDAYQKSVLDSLVHAKMLIDDSGKWAEWGGVTYRRGKQGKTVIILEDV